MKELCKKHTILFSIILSVIIMLLDYVPWWKIVAAPYANWLVNITRLLICLVIIRLLGLWKSAGFQKSGYAKSLLYGIPFYIMGIGSAVVSNWGMEALQFTSWINLLHFTFYMILVGATEEIWMRALILNQMNEKYGMTKKGQRKAIIISALIFGLIHFINLSYMDVINVIVQVIYAFAGGILFGAIFMKKRNIFAVSTIHFLGNWLSLAIGECFIGTSTVLSVQMTPLIIVITIMGGVGVPVLSAYCLMKE